MTGLNEAEAITYAAWLVLKWAAILFVLLLISNAAAYIVSGNYLFVISAEGYVQVLGRVVACLYGWPCSG